MKRLIGAIALFLTSIAVPASATAPLPLVPYPAKAAVSEGEYTLPKEIKLCIQTKNLTAESRAVADEAASCASALGEATGSKVVSQDPGNLSVYYSGEIASEGYALDITPKGIKIRASDPAGVYYAFRTVSQLMGPEVSAGVKGDKEKEYAVPCVSIEDSPRYPYRGFMLDVSRHFFDAAQVKKIIDVMAQYKMNRFHWHLTDDQGWRLPMPKYPKLTKEGATAHDVERNDFSTGKLWRDGKGVAYGPYSYTEAEIRDIVRYAKERHIEVIPEIDMPGHMVAAIHAYPQFSTDPESKLVPDSIPMDSDPLLRLPLGHFTHNIWNRGGVSRDILDVSNPQVMQFAKDVVDQLANLFPYSYIHIGGDEVPVLAWEKSASCQAMKEKLGLPNDRSLQSWFTKEIADYARTKHGKKIMGWNELITEKDVDMPTVCSLDPVIFCWVDAKQAAAKAQENGLKHVYTDWDHGYYINRSYRDFDKIGAGRDGSLAQTYMNVPPENDKCVGVQGTFWTEHVDRYDDMEYLMLPRLLVIAEQGWSRPMPRDYEAFMQRMVPQAKALEAGGYNYGKHQIPVR